jgi:hypothetical protein
MQNLWPGCLEYIPSAGHGTARHGTEGQLAAPGAGPPPASACLVAARASVARATAAVAAGAALIAATEAAGA